uniref:Lin1244/Lin1753-like N-terminal domain-containing protein n=1 Tax=viral metagenome TaxID=1070528 RepID=A0A6M3LPE1_9ZZZZ
MKWFKHDTDCDESEGLSYLLSREGFAGYGRWFRLLEIIAAKMDGTDRCHAEYPVQKWCSLLGLKQKKLISFLELSENKLKTKVVCCDNIIKIEVPNLLKKRDEYSKRSGQNQDTIRYKKKEERDKIKDREKELNTYKATNNKQECKEHKNVKNIFREPTFEEVSRYCLERKNSVNAKAWLSHYESNGWLVGRNKMKDWKAAVRTWEHSTISGGNGNAGIRTNRSDPGDKTLQNRTDAELAAIFARRDAAKAAAFDKATGNAARDNEADHKG